MGLSSRQMDAFLAVSRSGSFSVAAKRLHLTQSALSQRVQGLEQELQQTLFIRQKGGVILTQAGQRLLKYCQTKTALEEELLEEFKAQKPDELVGRIRLAAYSSVMRSLIMPALRELLRNHPKIQAEFVIRNTHLPGLLMQGEVDFIIVDHPFSSHGVERLKLGDELYVLVEAINYQGPEDLYLDNDPSDPATELFFRAQEPPILDYRRSFFGDVYGILDAVEAGLGRAILPRHMIQGDRPLRILKRYKSLPIEFALHYHRQAFYPALHAEVIRHLQLRVPALLKTRA